MGLFGGKSEEEQYEAILATKLRQHAQKDEKQRAGTDAILRRGDPFSWHGVIRALHDFALLDGEDKGY